MASAEARCFLLGGALAGELAAQKAGGNLWAGAFVGAILGGATSLAGGALGSAAASGIDSLVGGGTAAVTVGGTTHTLLAFVASGAIQGALAGAGTGLATGFAGGKGTAESMLISAAKGAAWGASLGALLGLGLGSIVGTGLSGTAKPDQYWNWGAFGQKFADFSSTGTALNSLDNVGGVEESIYQLASPGGFNGQNLAGLIPNLWTTSAEQAGWFSVPLTWVAPMFSGGATFAGSGFAAAVDISMAADQAGFSYAHQLSMLIGAAPYFIDYGATLVQIMDPSGYSQAETAFNNFFGSASPNNTG